MAYTELNGGSAFASGNVEKASQWDLIRTNFEDHEDRIVDAVADIAALDTRIDALEPAGAASQVVNAGFGSSWTEGFATEEVTLNTGAASTDSTANLLPANSEILAVLARLTQTITTAANWKLGDATTADRFTSANSTLTAGTTDYGFRHRDGTGATGPLQTTAAKVRITLNANPGAGKVRLVVFYRTFVAPTS